MRFFAEILRVAWKNTSTRSIRSEIKIQRDEERRRRYKIRSVARKILPREVDCVELLLFARHAP